MRLRFVWPLLAFVVLVALLWVGLSLNPREIPSPLIGQPAPAFSLPELHDPEKQVSHTDLLGEPVLLNVFASWCVSCRHEHGVLVELDKYGIPIYGLNYRDTRDDALRYLRAAGEDPYTAIAFDERGLVGIDWGVYATPETFLLDSQGIIRYKHIGPISPQIARDTIIPLYHQLLAEEVPSS
ncbi:DsbE family thiol:disulfide interchange protein [Thiorhodospira sibirica]|uniref:DsbE family thiol:disulfide interchange protein n=1 Tax=Thiorhodospira sibirica TaxID=154347 RepID=UPI00022C285D|nr:DsbE family thiol:disulfide interchange protein [Thiorhodospira sibirica]